MVWTEQTFDKLVAGEPEPLVSRMKVDNAMLINVLAREEDAFPVLRRLLTDNHEDRARAAAGWPAARSGWPGRCCAPASLTRLDELDEFGRRYVLTVDLPEDFALNQPLAHFALAALDVLDPEAEEYTLDIVSVIEAVLEGPRQILFAQQHAARGEAVAEMKADGIEYEERMALLDEITWPQPLAELLEATYEIYRESHPWLPRGRAGAEVDRAGDVRAGDELHRLRQPLPAGPVRGAGAALPDRRLPDAAPDRARGAPHAASSRTWSSGWGRRSGRPTPRCSTSGRRWPTPSTSRVRRRPHHEPPPSPRPISKQDRAFRVMIRNAMLRRVELVARDDLDGLMALERAAADRTDPPGEVVMTRVALGRRRSRSTTPSTTRCCSTPTPAARTLLDDRGRAARTWQVRADPARPRGPPRLGDRGGRRPRRLRRGRRAGAADLVDAEPRRLTSSAGHRQNGRGTTSAEPLRRARGCVARVAVKGSRGRPAVSAVVLERLAGCRPTSCGVQWAPCRSSAVGGTAHLLPAGVEPP